MIQVLFFASLREALGCSQVELDAGLCNSVDAVKAALAERFPSWRTLQEEQEVLVAVNQAMCKSNLALKADDEVAFFPQVTGG